MNKTWNDSDLARLSDDLDQELTAIFDQVKAALGPETDPADGGQGEAAPEVSPPVEADKADDDDWLPPGLLGEPEIPARLTPEVMREISRMIEEAVAKGVAAALAAFLKTD